ncbi:hypothetical protein [Gleimia hominis]|uniref:hypothetical protein n=1 Tax=Gleimia hominis TaxID=595468 RepID=UPI0028A7B34C|nr:hypothetical protein [Gleimia hominis]
MLDILPDASIQFLGNMDLFWLIAAAGGGFFGAVIGGNFAFGFTGVLILLGFGIAFATGSDVGFTYLAFGPVFGPHVAFAGAAAASAYAAKTTNALDDTGYGRDINTSLAGLGHPAILWVGALFGMGGYIVERLIQHIPWFGSHTDTVAATVVVSGLTARAIFGRTKVFGWTSKLEGSNRWLEWQEKPSQYLTLGFLSGIFGAGASLMLVSYAQGAGLPEGAEEVILANAKTLPFAISAIAILLLALGSTIGVTHHMTIIGGLAGVTFLPIVGNGLVALLLGGLFGAIAACAGELFARIFYDHGDTHIDPPAWAIWPCTTLVMGLGAMLG